MSYMFQQIIGREPGIGKPYKTRIEVKLASADDFMKYMAVPLEGIEDERVKQRFKPSLRSQLQWVSRPDNIYDWIPGN